MQRKEEWAKAKIFSFFDISYEIDCFAYLGRHLRSTDNTLLHARGTFSEHQKVSILLVSGESIKVLIARAYAIFLAEYIVN